MDEILFLAHRIPYPPDKGDKIRSWHFLRHLAAHFRVHLGCLLDDPADREHLAFLRERTASLHVEEIDPRRQKLLSLRGLATGEALTFPYFRSRGLARWAARLRAERPLKCVYVFSSGVAPPAFARDGKGPPVLVDFVDVDSEKWRQYAAEARPPQSWLFAREARLLARAERRIAERACFSTLVSEPEAALFRRRSGLGADKVGALGNGVDLEQFDAGRSWQSPFPAGERCLLFTGAMDYRANVEAVSWFAREILPLVRARYPDAVFSIVGARPTQAVRQLAGLEGVRVTGRVESVCPWLAHAEVVVAPLRVARGIQNKVLEAMAMARPVVATPEAQEGIDARDGRELLLAGDPAGLAEQVCRCLAQPRLAAGLGEAALALVRERHSWQARQAELDGILERVLRVGVGQRDAGAPGSAQRVPA